MADLTSPLAQGGDAFRAAMLQQAMLQRQAALDAVDQQKTQEQLALTAQQRATQKETADALAADRQEKTKQAAYALAESVHGVGQPLTPEEAGGPGAPGTVPPELVIPAPAPTLQQKLASVFPGNTVDVTGAPITVDQPAATFKGTEKGRLELAQRTKLQDIADGNFDLPEGTDPVVRSAMMVDAHLRLAGMPALAAGVLTPKSAIETSAAMDNAAQKLYEKQAANKADTLKPPLSAAEIAQLHAYELRKSVAERMAEPSKINAREDSQRDNAIKTMLGDMSKEYAPLLDKTATIQRLKETLASPGGVADAVAAPEFLSAMAGGFGSGLRMNNAELTRINNAQPIWSRLMGWLSAWNPESPDPAKQKEFYPQVIQPAMRAQMQQLAQYLSDRATARLNLFKEYRDKITDAKDAAQARHLKAEFDDKQLAAVFNPPGGGHAPVLPNALQPTGVSGPTVALPISGATPPVEKWVRINGKLVKQ